MVLFSAGAFAQTPSAITKEEIDAHLAKARVAAGFDFPGTLARLCVAPPRMPLTVSDAAAERYFTVTDECAEAPRLKLLQAGK